MHILKSNQKQLVSALLPLTLLVSTALPLYAQSVNHKEVKVSKEERKEAKEKNKEHRDELANEHKNEVGKEHLKEEKKEKAEGRNQGHESEVSEKAEKAAEQAQARDKDIPSHENHHTLGSHKQVDKGFDFTNNNVREMNPQSQK